jgi:hypothetical protein
MNKIDVDISISQNEKIHKMLLDDANYADISTADNAWTP